MQNVVVRKGKPGDFRHFSELILFTSPKLLPAVFGSKAKKIMSKIFHHRKHYYSFERSFFIEVNGAIAGMAMLHKFRARQREKIRLGLLLARYMNWRFPASVARLLKSEKIIKDITGGDCYLSNLAVYPEFRSLGLGTKLVAAVEDEAKSIGKKRVTMRVETYNNRAMELYQRLGYKIEYRSPSLKIRNVLFESFKISKPVAS